MYLANRDIKYAIECGKLIVNPPPEDYGAGYDETSIDLHLDVIGEAQVWDVEALQKDHKVSGIKLPELNLGQFEWEPFAEKYLKEVPEEDREQGEKQLVFRRGDSIILRPFGFLLWTTEEVVGTPVGTPELIAFVNAKSTRARTGVMVHFTAPTIHAGWNGKITLEITNLGPFHFVLEPGAVIAQLTVATISSRPDLTLKGKKKSATQGQVRASGSSKRSKPKPKKK